MWCTNEGYKRKLEQERDKLLLQLKSPGDISESDRNNLRYKLFLLNFKIANLKCGRPALGYGDPISSQGINNTNEFKTNKNQ